MLNSQKFLRFQGQNEAKCAFSFFAKIFETPRKVYVCILNDTLHTICSPESRSQHDLSNPDNTDFTPDPDAVNDFNSQAVNPSAADAVNSVTVSCQDRSQLSRRAGGQGIQRRKCERQHPQVVQTRTTEINEIEKRIARNKDCPQGRNAIQRTSQQQSQ